MKITRFFDEVLGCPLRNRRNSCGAYDEKTGRLFLRIWKDQIRPSPGMQGGEQVQIYWRGVKRASYSTEPLV